MAFELRVHGISGVGADEMLDRPLVVRVAGDDHAAFYRPRPAYGDATGPPGAVLEAYRWANLTRDSIARTLWLLLLLPVLLSNVAMWMCPATSGPGAVAKAVCRLFAATLTGMFVLMAVGVTLDLVAWQCAGHARCAAGRPYLSWLADLPPGWRLTLLALPPIAAICVLWWLGARTWRAYESFGSSNAERGDGLDAVGHWDGLAVVGRLRSIHVAVAFGTLDASLLAVLASHDRSGPGYALAGATGGLLAGCAVLLCIPAMAGREAAVGWVEPVTRGLRTAALGLTALTLAYAVAPRVGWAATGQLPWYGPMVNWLFVAQVALLVGLGAVVLWQRRRRRGALGIFGGLGAPALGFAAMGLSVAFSAALAYRLADFLDRGGIPTPGAADPGAIAPPQPPTAYEWAALVAPVAVLASALTGAYMRWVTLRRRRRAAAQVVEQDFPDAPPEAGPRLRKVRDAIARVRVTERLWASLATYAALAVLSRGLMILAVADFGPVDLADRLAGEGWATQLVAAGVNLGAHFIGLFALGLVVVGLLAYRYTGIQRVIGVLWDVGTFWPRTAHPLAPPCYAERVVPELTRRVRCLAEQGGVVLSGHSHGAVLMVATVLQLPPESLHRVALLTYGSPLRRLYAGLFPAYVGDEVLRAVGDRVGWRWRNLWRDTDPIGGWIFSAHRAGEPPRLDGPPGEVDWRLRDPRGVVVEECDTVPPPMQGHNDYHTDKRFDDAVRELIARLGSAPPAPARPPR